MDHKTKDDCSTESIIKYHLVFSFLINYLASTLINIDNVL